MNRGVGCSKTWLDREEIDTQHPTVESDGDFPSFLAYEARFAGR